MTYKRNSMHRITVTELQESFRNVDLHDHFFLHTGLAVQGKPANICHGNLKFKNEAKSIQYD